MNKMKIGYILLVAIGLGFCGNKNSNPENKLKIETTLKMVFDIPRIETGNRFFLIGLKLVNISDSPIQFLTSTCSTGANLVLDSKEIIPVINNCSSNGITTITLNPKQEFSCSFLFQVIDKYPEYLKIGWIVMTYENSHSALEYYKYLDKYRDRLENVIWANPLELKSFSAYPYEIK